MKIEFRIIIYINNTNFKSNSMNATKDTNQKKMASIYPNNYRYITTITQHMYRTAITPATRYAQVDWSHCIDSVINASTTDTLNIPINILSEDEYNANLKKENTIDSSLTLKPGIVMTDESKTANTVSPPIDNTQPRTHAVWQVISKLRYYDKDEYAMRKNMIKVNQNTAQLIIDTANDILIPNLKRVLSETAILDGIDAHDYNDLLMHIIMKGRVFYDGIFECPDVALYLCDQFYPVYTWISEIARSG